MVRLSLFPIAVGVVSPWLLFGGVALSAVPLMIHLLYRHRYQDRPWAAMQFLAEAVRKQARRIRLESLVLLVVRTLLILFAGLALSQPFTQTPAGVDATTTARHRMLILDASLSMSAMDGEQSSFANAREIARRIVREASAGDAFHLVRIAGTPPYSIIRQPAHAVDQVLDEIDRLQQTEERGDPAAALEAAIEQMSRNAGAEWTVVVLSDFQRSNWTPSDARELEEIRTLLKSISETGELLLIDAAGATKDNAAVATLQTESADAVLSETTRVTATLQNLAPDHSSDRLVELLVNGLPVEQQEVTLPAGTSVPVSFRFPNSRTNESVVEVRLSDDRLALDNRRWLVLPTRKPLDVLVVGGPSASGSLRSSARFVELALSPRVGSSDAGSAENRNAITPTVVSDGRLPELELSRYACVFLCDVPLVTDAEAGLLREYVQAGGGLVISLGEHVRSESYNRVLFGADGGLIAGRLADVVAASGVSEEGYRFEPRQYAHPILQPFAGNVDAGLLTTEIYRYFRFESPVDSDSRIVLRYSTGDPAIVERDVGAGRVFLVTTALDDSWSNWALWPSFVPMMHELVRDAAAGGLESRQLTVGEPIIRRLHSAHVDAGVELIGPNGESKPLDAGAVATDHGPSAQPENTPSDIQRRRGLLLATPPILSSGAYQLMLGEPANVSEAYAVNVDTVESDLAALDDQSVARDLLPEEDFEFLTGWTKSPDRELGSGGGRASLTDWFLKAAFCLLLVDLLMAWRFAVGAAVLAALVVSALAVQLAGVSPWFAFPAAVVLVGPGLMLVRRKTARLPASIASPR